MEELHHCKAAASTVSGSVQGMAQQVDVDMKTLATK